MQEQKAYSPTSIINVPLKGWWEVLKATGQGFGENGVMKMAASLAFYTVITMGPLLIVLIFLIELFLRDGSAQTTILQQIEELAGKSAAQQVEQIITNAGVDGGSLLATTFGFVTLAVGATTVFSDMQNSLNRIWRLRPRPDRGLFNLVFTRLMSFATVAVLGFLLLVSLIVNAFLDLAFNQLRSWFPDVAVFIIYAWNLLFMFVVVSAMFAFIFKVLPDAKIRWRDALPGALITAVLFLLARWGIAFYLGKSDIGSTYGAAGALVLLLFWVYFSSTVLFVGAEFTKAFTVRYGADVVPHKHAMMVRTVSMESDKRTVQENEADTEHDKQQTNVESKA